MCVVCVQELELYCTEPRQLLDMFDIIMLHSTYICLSCVFRRWNYTVQSPDSCLTSLCYIVHIYVYMCVSCVFRRWNYTLQSPDSCLTCLTSSCYIVYIYVYMCVSCVFRRRNYTLQSPDRCLTCLTSLCYIVHIYVCRVCSGAGIILYRAPTAA